jgi:uncharacterized protein YdaU (DUF1376 family)
LHYYKKNLGDYAKKAGRLTILQHGVYNLLIDACYDREKFPTRDEAIDWTWASSQEEIDGVNLVLRKFFNEQPDGTFVQKRIKGELADYQAKAATNKQIAIDRETKRKEKSTKRSRTVHEPLKDSNEAPPNHKPLTNNQEPLKENREKSKRFVAPQMENVLAYFKQLEANNPEIEADKFINFYESKNWYVGKNKMKSWEASVRGWISRDNQKAIAAPSGQDKRGFLEKHTDKSWATEL